MHTARHTEDGRAVRTAQRTDAQSVVPSSGSTAMSMTVSPSPMTSPQYSMGASSFAPSPITTTPFMGTLLSTCAGKPSPTWTSSCEAGLSILYSPSHHGKQTIFLQSNLHLQRHLAALACGPAVTRLLHGGPGCVPLLESCPRLTVETT